MLPFDTIEEAATLLGRNLTVAETMWFKYSAKKSDYYLYCHNILFLFLIFSVVPLPLVFVEMMRSLGFDKYKIQPKVSLSLPEMFKCYKDVMRMFVLVVGPLQLVSYPSIKIIGIRTGLPLPSLWEIVAQLTVYFMIEDYTNYWIHRFLHGKWGYEKIHRVHHEYTAPIGFAAPYAHWLEVLILGIPSFLGPAIVPGHMITFWLWIALRQIEAIETHSGYDFPWTPTRFIPFYGGADYHDYHHYVGGQSQSNFASVFTYCDYIYGTDKGYRYHKKVLRKLVMVMWCYSSVVVTDPGGVPPNWRPFTDEEKGDADPLVGSGYGSAQLDPKQSAMVAVSQEIRFCHKCKQFKPPRAHHCSVCRRCILKMDHHCVWVVNCVGALNYKYFLLFLFYTFLETTLVSLLLLRVFMEFFNEGEIDETPGSLAATFITFVLNIAFTLSILGFLIMHITLVGANTSTIEAYEKKTSPKWRYDLGWKKNFEQVFGLDKKYWFIPAYSEDDLRRLPALHGFEYPTRPDLEPLQQH
ncbi:hypothetical protein GOBAR_DD30853 [Gossypium barbadense]|nr:hypothetical protein GOBAR_DD30853 [Gossypium barbadense]